MQKRQIDALILAGGLGTRLQTILPDRQKVSAPVCGVPVVELVVRQLYKAGLRRIVLATGYLSDQVDTVISNLELPAVDIKLSKEPFALGTGGAVVHSLHLVNSEDFMVCNGDTVIRADFERLIAYHYAKGADVTFLGAEVDDASRYGILSFSDDGIFTGFEEKSNVKSGLLTCVNTGVFVAKKSFFRSLSLSPPFSLEKDVFESHVMRDFSVRVFSSKDTVFYDIGTVESYFGAGSFLNSEY
jgi:D-glycero-alpha-D-manno-heptose 1-phosphate guanylyltransferase